MGAGLSGGDVSHANARSWRRGVILSVLAKDLASSGEARSFASTLRITTRGRTVFSQALSSRGRVCLSHHRASRNLRRRGVTTFRFAVELGLFALPANTQERERPCHRSRLRASAVVVVTPFCSHHLQPARA